MTAALLIIVGAVLCFWGSASVRMAVLAAGFGLGWLLGQIFDASWTTALLVAAGCAALTFLLTLIFARFVVFVAGLLVGALIGARVFLLVTGSDPDWLLGVIFVPCAALVGGFLAGHYHQAFLRWGTALAGASLILAGVGQVGADSARMLWRPDTAAGRVVFGVVWLVLTLAGYRTQRHPDDVVEAAGDRR